METKDWYRLDNPETLVTPCLLVYPDRIQKNIGRMLAIAGDPSRIRPHIKTHKTAEIIRMQMEKGIYQFKCATIAEAELLGKCGAQDVLLAMQPVGHNLERFFNLMEAFPNTHFSTLVDNEVTLNLLGAGAGQRQLTLSLYIDLNTGMDRTGIIPGAKAYGLYRLICDAPHLEAEGLHAYDGHIRDADFEARKKRCEEAFAPVAALKTRIEASGMVVKHTVVGGSPSFPVHALNPEVITSPGTTLLWDARYESLFGEMGMLPAAVLLGRVLSKPADKRVCLDLGHKAMAPEMPFPRVQLLEAEDCEQISQSEEHLVLECPGEDQFEIGREVYAIPMHICPTVAKYPRLITVQNGQVTGTWEVAARDHQLSI